nr:unnamed protein product [Callosobruchus analis]
MNLGGGVKGNFLILLVLTLKIQSIPQSRTLLIPLKFLSTEGIKNTFLQDINIQEANIVKQLTATHIMQSETWRQGIFVTVFLKIHNLTFCFLTFEEMDHITHYFSSLAEPRNHREANPTCFTEREVNVQLISSDRHEYIENKTRSLSISSAYTGCPVNNDLRLTMRQCVIVLLALAAFVSAKHCPTIKKSNSKLFCYYGKVEEIDCRCSHVVLPSNLDNELVTKAREQAKGAKLLVTVHEFNQALVDLLKSRNVDGMDVNLRKLDSKTDINDFISTVRDRLNTDLYVAVSVPPKAEILAKYFDFKALSKHADAFVLQTAFLGASKNVTFHPSRLSGLWDMQNTDSIVDLVSGLGAPLSKIVVASPVQAFHFKLQNEEYSAPGSPALEVKSITRDELCSLMNNGANWTLERDQDRAGPYIFSEDNWIAFDDATSLDIKSKYARVRGLAGIALKDVAQDTSKDGCEGAVDTVYSALSAKGRAPRAALLHDLERELEGESTELHAGVRLSPYRITRVVDIEGKHHVIRQDTRTEFSCTRQGYFVHPRSCNRFYRCVKFDQTSEDYSVFEFECPAGLAFDERVEVCVWPGSLPEGQPCQGSAEIAPVPRQRFVCPHEQGYYADPENCRWFFACMDHGTSELTPYEFRCPYGLYFDSDRFVCEWPWLVPKCGRGREGYSEFTYGDGGPSLDHYDGLGSLGLVKLGGLSGHVDQPIVYSNVGASHNGYSGGFGSLGYGATFALKNAGLLKEDQLGSGKNSFAYQQNAGNQQYSADFAGTSKRLYNQGSDSYNDHYNTLYNGAAFQANSASVGSYGQKVAAEYSFNDASGIRYEADLGSNVNNFLAYQNTENLESFESQTEGAFQNRGSQLGGAVSFHSLKQYHGQHSGSQYEANLEVNSDTLNHYQDNSNRGQTSGDGVFSSYSTNQHNTEAQRVQYYGNLATNGGSVVQHQSKGNSQGIGAYSTNLYYGQNTNAQYAANLANNVDSLLKYKNTIAQLSLDSANMDIGRSFASGHTTAYQSNIGGVGGNTVTAVRGSGLGATSSQSFKSYYGDNRNVIATTYNIENLQKHGRTDYDATLQKHGSLDNAASVIVSEQEHFGHKDRSQNFGSFHENTLVNSLDTVDHNANLDYDSRQAYQSGVNGNINIVGGGYSAVGDRASGIEVINNGETYVTIAQSTPAPVSVTTVTSVPLPSLKTYSGFENYNGGVVANIPELQYKVQGETGLRNVSYGYGSSIPVPVLTSTDLRVKSGHFSTVPAIAPASTTARPFSVHTNSGGASGFGFQSTGARYDTPSPAIRYVSTTPSPSTTGSFSTYGSTESAIHHGTYSISSPGVTYVSTTQRPAVTIPISSHGTTANAYSTVQTYETPAVSFVSTTARPVSTVSHNLASSVAFSGASLTSYNQFSPSTTLSADGVENQRAFGSQTDELSGGYNYERPSASFEEVPEAVIYSTPKPVLSTSKSAYVSENVDTSFGGYNYKQPAVRFEENPGYVTVTSPKSIVLSSTVKPRVYYESKPSDSFNGYNYVSPRVEVSSQTASVSNTRPLITATIAPLAKTRGYIYNRPTATFKESPTSIVREEPGYSYEKPSIAFVERPSVHSNVISKFTIGKPAIQYSDVGHNQGEVSANYQNIVNANSYQNVAQPDLVSSYHYQQPVSRISYKEIVQQAVAKPAVSSTVQPIDYTVQSTPRPAVVSSYFQQQPVSKYSYQDVLQQAVAKQPTPAPTYVPTTTVSPTYYYPEPAVTEYSYPSTTYNYVAPSASKSAVVSSYSYTASSTEKPAILAQQQGYIYPKPSINFVEEPRTTVTFVPSTTPVVTRVQTQFGGYNYQKPTIAFIETTTPRPYVTYEAKKPVKEEEYVKKTAYVTGEEFSNGISPVVATGNTPVVVENYQAFNYDKIRANANNYVQSTPKPTFISTISTVASRRNPITETPHYYYHDSRHSSPTFRSTYLPPTKEYLPVTTHTTPAYEPVRISTPTPSTFTPRLKVTQTYLPPTREYLPVTTPEYEPMRTVAPVTTTYLPPTTYRARVRVTTQAPSTTYLPARISTTTYLPPSTRNRVKVTSQTPSSTYLPVEVTTLSRNYLPSRTVIKQNDIHPLLSAKLGAQCTCVTNALRSGRKQKIIVIDDDDDDGYVVDNGRMIENYEYDSRKVLDITPTPEVYVKNNRRPSARVSDGEILNAVKTGLKLVKEAAREGAEEGVEKVLSRSRDSIECNRAGLFRHPNQCNKFYSCRWDCTKKRYTLHMFDCPIHLTFDGSLGACNWPSQGPACMENTLLPSA